MKTVNVFISVQMDIKEDQDQVEQVRDVLEAMDGIIRNSGLEASPSIFSSDVDNSSIVDVDNEDEDE
jgi:cell division protein FtsX